MKKIFFVLFCVMTKMSLQAQYAGVWHGTVGNTTDSMGFWEKLAPAPKDDDIDLGNYFELFIVQTGNKISGYSITHWGDSYAKAAIKGTCNARSIKFEEYEILEERGNANSFWCFFDSPLILSCRGKGCYLKGDFKSYSADDGSPCSPGRIVLKRIRDRV